MVKVLQLSVEVSKCYLPPFITHQFQEYLLTVALNQQLYASTSWKKPERQEVDFGTRLFIRLDKIDTDSIPQCSVTLTGLTQGRTKVEVATGTILSKVDGTHKVELRVDQRNGGSGWVELEFTRGMVEVKETKSSMNRSNSFKASDAQKQSSLKQRESPEAKTLTNFHSRALLTPSESKESLDCSQMTAKVSKEKILSPSNTEMESSMATSRVDFKVLDETGKCQQTTTLLSLQIKIDQLQQTLGQVTFKLSECNSRLQSAESALGKQKKRNSVLQLQKQQLLELLTLEETKSKMALDHVLKLGKLWEELQRGEDQGFELIEEKDEIVMLNQELQIEVNLKQNVIEQLKAQIACLKEKIVGLETKTVSILPSEPSSIKKMQQLPGKELQKIKSQKKLADRKGSNFNKKQEDTKDTVNKAKQPEKRKSRKETEVKPGPSQRGTKTISIKNQPIVSPRIPKGKVTKINVKAQLKPHGDVSHRKSTTSSIIDVSNNLMINSRNVEAQKNQ